MTTLVAMSAFGTFMVFIALGIGALVFAAALDRTLGKERALFVYALGLLALTAFVLKAEASSGSPAKPGVERDVTPRAVAGVMEPDLLSHPPFAGTGGDERRNGFERFSDTRPLPPITLDVPPEIAGDFPLPPPIPGPAPAARRLLRGTAPELSEDDASAPFEVPPVRFSEFVPKAEDVYDSWEGPQNQGTARIYVSIVSINGVRPHEAGFGPLKLKLITLEGRDGLTVEWANIGTEKAASKVLDDASRARVSKQNRSTDKANDPKFTAWHLRKSVENEFSEAMRQALSGETLETTRNVSGLKDAARRMATVGKTGKEGGAAWLHAAALLERALKVAQETSDPSVQADLLVQLVDAYKALNDEQAMLKALKEYAAAAPNNGKPWLGLGELALHMLQLPAEALQYFAKARQLDPNNEAIALGEGDAFTRLGRHAEALAAYERAGAGFPAQVRRAEAALRLGDLAKAQAASDAALGMQSEAPRALLVRGAILYTRGTDLAAAKSAFAMAAASTSDQGVWRAQALYDLGLTAWRLKETRAAAAAFDACEAALRMGASPSRFADETVVPSLGRALIAYTLKPKGPAVAGAPPAPEGATPLTVHRESVGEYLAAARDEARRVAYLDHFAGVLASGQGNVAAAIKALRRSLLLAPDATELDPLLALNHLRWGYYRQSRAEVPAGAATRDREERRLDAILAQPADQHFEAAVAFAARASKNDAADSDAYLAMLRETWVRLQDEHLSPRKRFEAAVAAADRVLTKDKLREQPLALAMRGYAYYRLGGDENYDKSLRDLAQVLDKIQDAPGEKWLEWRAYAQKALAQIKHWRSLEEKVVSFEGLNNFPKDWVKAENGGIQVNLDKGLGEDASRLPSFLGTANKDGSILTPLVALVNQNLFQKDTFEELTLKLRIPVTRDGSAVNNVVFGVAVQGPTSGGSGGAAGGGGGQGGIAPRHPGIGVFYDKAKVAARIGTGLLPEWKEGDMKRVRVDGQERAWPTGEWVTVRIVREDASKGAMAIYLNNDEEPVVEDKVSGFKGSGGKAELWIGGWSTTAQQFTVQVKDIRIVRIKK